MSRRAFEIKEVVSITGPHDAILEATTTWIGLGRLRIQTTVHRGRSLNVCFEQNMPGSASFLAEAAKSETLADAEPDHVTRVKKYLLAAAQYLVGADSLESREALPKKALDVYHQVRALIDRAPSLMREPPSVDSRAVQKKRLQILCWKCKAWSRYRIYHLRQKHGLIEVSPSYRIPFYEIVAPLEKMTLADRPPKTDFPIDMLCNIKTEMLESDMLQEAFGAWSSAESLIVETANKGFCDAVDSAVAESVHLLSKPNTIVRYIREFLARIEHFKSCDRECKRL